MKKNSGEGQADAAPEKTQAEIDAATKKAATALKRSENAKLSKAAKVELGKFKDTKEFKSLPETVRAAITHLSAVATASAAPIMSVLTVIFPEIGTKVNELDIFKRTKKGRSEFRRVVRTGLIRAAAAERMWINFDEKTEEWEFVAVGETKPEGYNGPEMPEPKAPAKPAE